MDSPLIIPQCRICYESSNPNQLFSPCKCSGTSQYVHRECLYDWIRLSENIEAKNKCSSIWKRIVFRVRFNLPIFIIKKF